MTKPIKFKAIYPKVRIANRCVVCGKIIPYGYYICNSCRKKRSRIF